MNREVLSVKEHTCPTCGGLLRVDTVKQMYECAFCGVTFDYEYFREDDVLEKANRALAAGEFQSADDAYKFMLTKEPNNFVALRGSILAGMHMRDTRSFGDVSIYETMDYDNADGLVDRAVKNAKSEHHDYFSAMKELVDLGHEYKDERISLTKLRVNKSEQDRNVRRAEDKKYDVYVTATDTMTGETSSIGPKGVLVAVIVIYLLWSLICVSIFAASRSNPYSVERYYGTTSAEATTQSAGYSLPSYQSYNLSDVSKWSSYSIKADKEVERKKKYAQWEVEHKDDGQTLLGALIVPVIPVGFIISVLAVRIRRERDFDREIDRELDKLGKIGSEVGLCEEKIELIEKKMIEAYKELRERDPMPDIHHAK